jgi:hypothetical protein
MNLKSTQRSIQSYWQRTLWILWTTVSRLLTWCSILLVCRVYSSNRRRCWVSTLEAWWLAWFWMWVMVWVVPVLSMRGTVSRMRPSVITSAVEMWLSTWSSCWNVLVIIFILRPNSRSWKASRRSIVTLRHSGRSIKLNSHHPLLKIRRRSLQTVVACKVAVCYLMVKQSRFVLKNGKHLKFYSDQSW